MTQEIPSVLACDVGNTAIGLAVIKDDQAGEVTTMQIGDLSNLGKKLAELWQPIEEPPNIVASSVNPAGLKALEAAAGESLSADVLVIGRDLPLPMETDLPEPESIGTDRLCAAVAAFDKLGVSCVVADFGTAVTVDCVNEKGVFLGGAILPGLAMSAASLTEKTAFLPKVELANPDWVFGKDTKQAIVGGLVFGVRGAVRSLVESYASKLGHWPLLIATGGDAELICSDPVIRDLVQAVVGDLTLRGVALAYYNSLVK